MGHGHQKGIYIPKLMNENKNELINNQEINKEVFNINYKKVNKIQNIVDNKFLINQKKKSFKRSKRQKQFFFENIKQSKNKKKEEDYDSHFQVQKNMRYETKDIFKSIYIDKNETYLVNQTKKKQLLSKDNCKNIQVQNNENKNYFLNQK